MNDTKQKVIVIVGPTASGKTSLSIAIAKKYNGEVISADSRQVYKGLDIGSGKVTKEEMDGIPHHLLDIANPVEVYTASDFVQDGIQALKKIQKHKHLPIIAGGTFFYIDMLLGRVSSPEVPPNPKLRSSLEKLTAKELLQQLQEKDPRRAQTIDQQNPRRLIRALEIVDTLGEVPEVVKTEPYDVLTLGVSIPKEQLYKNIHIRLQQRLEEGMVAEVETLLTHGVTHNRLEALGLEYRYISRYLRNELSYNDMIVQLETKIRQFAKQQMTWLKRDTSIHWHPPQEKENIYHDIELFLAQCPPSSI